MSHMIAVGIKVLKNKLSEYVRLAARGERILVTDRDRVVAELIAPRADAPATGPDAEMVEAVRNGWIALPRTELPPLPPRRPIADSETVLRWLNEAREDRL